MRAMLLLALLAPGCGDPATGSMQLSWLFADGRRCTDAGASGVVISPVVGPKTAAVSYACTAGLPPSTVSVDGVARDGTLTLSAISPANDELYRGTVVTDAALTAATVTLYATFAR